MVTVNGRRTTVRRVVLVQLLVPKVICSVVKVDTSKHLQRQV